MNLPVRISFSDASCFNGQMISGPDLILEASDGNTERYHEFKAKLDMGIPAPYISGYLYFRGHRFEISEKAYITDPELSYVVDIVMALSQEINKTTNRRPLIAEFGVGAGALLMSLAIENPDADYAGFDLDAEALEVARSNASLHCLNLTLFESNYFDQWSFGRQPDILFADPPWGSRDDLYDDERSAEYYDRMPELSAYPSGGRVAIHQALIEKIQALRWTTCVVLNLGVIPDSLVNALLQNFKKYELYYPTPDIKVVAGFLS